MSDLRIALLVTHVRPEEKLLIEAFESRGIEPHIILDRSVNINLTTGAEQVAPSGIPWSAYSVVLERCVSTSRGMYLQAILNSWGIATINSYATAAICADKLLTTLALAQAGVPQPSARVAFDEESAIEAIEDLRYPAVLKPATGSWGRLLARVNDRAAAEAIIEHRLTLGGYTHHTFYVQEYVQKPDRDTGSLILRAVGSPPTARLRLN